MPSLDQLRNLALDYGPALAGPVASGLINRSAATSATNKLVEGADRAESVIQPYADVGTEALKSVNNFGLDELLKDPGFQFRMSEGQKLMARRQASGGSLSSGAAFKAMQQYTQNQASQEYGAAWNRLMQRVGIGQEGSRQLVDLISARAEALANGDVARANALTGMISGIQSGIEGVQDRKQIEQLLGIGPGNVTAPASAYSRAPVPASGSVAPITGTTAAGAAGIGALANLAPTAAMSMPSSLMGGTAASNALAAEGLIQGGVATTPLAGPAAANVGSVGYTAPTTGVTAGGGGFAGALATATPFVAAANIALGGITLAKQLKFSANDVANLWTPIQADFGNRLTQVLSSDASPQDKLAQVDALWADLDSAGKWFESQFMDQLRQKASGTGLTAFPYKSILENAEKEGTPHAQVIAQMHQLLDPLIDDIRSSLGAA